jgi:hypothetical protein
VLLIDCGIDASLFSGEVSCPAMIFPTCFLFRWETAHEGDLDDTYFFEVGPRPDFADDGRRLAEPRHIDRE